MPACDCSPIKDSDYTTTSFNWRGKTFYVKNIPHLFYTPVGIKRKFNEILLEAQNNGFHPVRPLCILSETGLFNGRLMIEIENPKEAKVNVVTFEESELFSTIYMGDTYNASPGVRDLLQYLQMEGKPKPEKIFLWHTTCPECSTKRDCKTVIFAQLR